MASKTDMIAKLKAEVSNLDKESVDSLLKAIQEHTKTDKQFANLVKEIRQNATDLHPYFSQIGTSHPVREDITAKDVIVIIIIILFFP